MIALSISRCRGMCSGDYRSDWSSQLEVPFHRLWPVRVEVSLIIFQEEPRQPQSSESPSTFFENEQIESAPPRRRAASEGGCTQCASAHHWQLPGPLGPPTGTRTVQAAVGAAARRPPPSLPERGGLRVCPQLELQVETGEVGAGRGAAGGGGSSHHAHPRPPLSEPRCRPIGTGRCQWARASESGTEAPRAGVVH